MRIVDVYRDCGSYRSPIAIDCIQYGEIRLSRTPITKMYTMADGSPCMYTAACDTAEMTVQLECGCENAALLAQHARLGKLVFAGLSWGVNSAPTLPPVTGVVGYITGAVQVQPRSVKADLYTVSIPVQLEVNADGTYKTLSVPAVKADLVLDRQPEILHSAGYRYEVGSRFVRRQVITTGAASIAVQCTADIPAGNISPYIFVCRQGTNEILLDSRTQKKDCRLLEGTLPLSDGLNCFSLTAVTGNIQSCKPQHILFSVYRD